LFLIFKCDKIPERFGLNASMLKLRKIGLCGGFLFAAGFILCFSFVLNGYKWELTRFLIPGISIGMFGFSLAVINFETERKSSRFLQHFIIAIFVFGGPAVNLVGTSSVNAYHLMSNGLVAPVLFEIIGSGPVVK